MRLKNILKYGFLFLAAGTLLTGCGGNSGEDFDYKVVAEKPKEIDGFLGNTVDVKPKSGDLIATFEIEDYGTIKAVLFLEAAPLGVENFRKLCDDGFYENLTIHRVMEQFMFQGGSLNGDGTGGEAAVNDGSFGIETAQNARHFYGALCYANAGGQNSTQFYIVNNTEEQDLNAFNGTRYAEIIEEGKRKIKQAHDLGLIAAEDDYRSQTQKYQNTINFFENATDGIKELYKKGGTPSLDGNYTVFGQVYEGFDVLQKISSVEVTENSSGEKSKPVKDIYITNITVSEYK